MEPAPFSVEPPPPSPLPRGAGEPLAPPAPSGWSVLRPYVAFAAVLLLLMLPPAGPVAQGAIAVAFVAVLGCLWPVRREASTGPSRWLLALGGVTGVLAPLLYANPWTGIDSTEWLWTYWSNAGAWMPKADILLWVLVFVVALVASAFRGARAAKAVVLGGVVLLAARALAERGAISMVRVDRVNLLWTLSALAIGGGLLHLASPSTARRGTARVLAFAGALGIVSVYAAWFPPENGGRLSTIAYYADEIPRLLEATVGSAEADAAFSTALGEQLWAVGVPFLAQVLAVGCALVVSLMPSGVRARPVRWLAALGVLALAATWVVPVRAGLWFRADEVSSRGFARVAQAAAECFMKAGLSPWLCGVGALAAMLRPGDLRADPTPFEARRRWISGLYGAAAALAILVVGVGFRPEGGSVVNATVAQVLAAGRWDPPTAILAFEGSFCLLTLAAVFLPAGRVRGLLVGVVAALVLGALSPVDRRSVGGVEVFVGPALGAIAAGAALAAARGGRAARWVAVGSSLVLLALLLYPTMQPEVPAGSTPPYESNLWSHALAPLFSAADGAALASLLGEPGRWLILGLAGAGVLALLGAAARSRVLGGVAVAWFAVVACGVPAVLTVLGTAGGGLPGDATESVLRLGTTLRVLLVPYAAALCGAAVDLGEPRRAASPATTGAPPAASVVASELAH